MTEVHRTNINIYRDDYEFLLEKYGYGWTRQVRHMIHEVVIQMKITEKTAVTYYDEASEITPGMWDIVKSPTIDLAALIKAHNDE